MVLYGKQILSPLLSFSDYSYNILRNTPPKNIWEVRQLPRVKMPQGREVLFIHHPKLSGKLLLKHSLTSVLLLDSPNNFLISEVISKCPHEHRGVSWALGPVPISLKSTLSLKALLVRIVPLAEQCHHFVIPLSLHFCNYTLRFLHKFQSNLLCIQ